MISSTPNFRLHIAHLEHRNFRPQIISPTPNYRPQISTLAPQFQKSRSFLPGVLPQLNLKIYCNQPFEHNVQANNSQRFSEGLQSGHAKIMFGFFPGPSGNFELNMEQDFIYVSGDDLLVLFSVLTVFSL